MKSNKVMVFAGILAVIAVAFCTPALAAVTPSPPYEAAQSAAANPAPYTWTASVASYKGYIIYAGSDRKIHALNPGTGVNLLVCDTSALSDPWASVFGFMVTSDGMLYFHDNTFPSTTKIFRADLTKAWPVQYQSLTTNCQGNIYAFTQNPWTQEIWFCSAAFMGNMYLYKVAANFQSVTQVGAGFAPPHGGGSGPVAFNAPQSLLYGESVWGGNGYFHEVDAATGAITAADYLVLPGGLAAAAIGYDNAIYAASGPGKAVYQITDAGSVAVAQTGDDAQGLCFGQNGLVVAELSATGQSVFSTLKKPVYGTLTAPAPGVYVQSYALAWYQGDLLYAGTDGRIYAMDVNTGATALVSDTSALKGPASSVSAFCVVRGDHLYFSDNGQHPSIIYGLNLTAGWPAAYTATNTLCQGTIAEIAQNPFTGTLWFTTFDVMGQKIRLYEIIAAGLAVKRVEFEPQHGGAAGPVVFTEASTALVGESVNNGNGYLHMVDTTDGTVTRYSFFSFAGGIVSAKPGYENAVYVTTGWGRSLYQLQNNAATLMQTSTGSIWGLAYNGNSVFTSELNPISGQMVLKEYHNPPAAPAYAELAAANPAFYTWNASIGYATSCIFYAGTDGKVYARNKDTTATVLFADTSAYATGFSAVYGFISGNDGYMYFHENVFPTTRIFRTSIAGGLPATVQTLNTGCQGSIYALIKNPWTDVLYFASGDIFAGRFYLYQVAANFSSATLVADFAAPHLGGNGPIIFAGPNLCLYGESVWGGNGYFHLLDLNTGKLVQDFYEFDGGLVGASYGRLLSVYAVSGNGQSVYQLAGGQKTEIMRVKNAAQGIVFDGVRFFVSLMDGQGHTSIARLGAGPTPAPPAPPVPGPAESSSGCFVSGLTGAPASPGALLVFMAAMVLLLANAARIFSRH
ncbi:MAG: hypothetical protein AB1921_09480 [Thermodesulfobacteriota bacterium]